MYSYWTSFSGLDITEGISIQTKGVILFDFFFFRRGGFVKFLLFEGLEFHLGPLAELLHAFRVCLRDILSYHFFEHVLNLLVAVDILDVFGVLPFKRFRMTFHGTVFFHRVTTISMEHAVLSSTSSFQTKICFSFLRDWLVVVERNHLLNRVGLWLRELQTFTKFYELSNSVEDRCLLPRAWHHKFH